MHRGGPGGRMPAPKVKDFKGTTKKIMKVAKPFRTYLIVSLVFAFLGAGLSIIGPSQTGRITNIIQQSVSNTPEGAPIVIDFNAIYNIMIILIVIYLLGCFFSILQGMLMSVASQRLTQKLRSDIANKVNRLPLKYIDKRSYGDILSVITNDVDMIGQTISSVLNDIVRAVTTILVAMFIMFFISWQMALVSVFFAPLNFLLISLVTKKSQKQFKKNQANLGKVNGYIEESYSGHDILTVFNASASRKIKFDELNTELRDTAWKSQFYSGLMHPLTMFVGNLSYITVAIIGALNSSMVGNIQSMLIYNRRFSQPFNQIAQSMTSVQSGMAAAERVFDFLDAEEMSSELGFEIHSREIKGNIDFKNVKFGYDEGKEIIHDFTLSVKAGQKIAIVGPTGAGKTTLVNLLMKFYEINSGDIVIDGVSINEMTRAEVHEAFGMVLQDTWLFKGTMKENILFSEKDVDEDRLKYVAKRTNIDHFIESLPKGYDTFIEDSNNVSQGQRQLITIARAMIKNAPILILDEATSNVDTRTEILIQEAMDELMKGRTSFVIAHRLSTIRNADLILVLNEGDIVESGSHDQLMEKEGFYYSLYNSQFEA